MPYTKHLQLEQVLQRVDAEHLKRFILKDTASEALTAFANAGQWFELLHRIDGQKRERIEAELGRVGDIANANGMRMLVDRLSGANVVFDPEATPHQLAMFCRLEHPGVFDYVYDRYWFEQGQTFVEYRAAEAISGDLTKEAVGRLAEAIKREASQQAEGKRCAIRSYTEEDRCFLIVHHLGYRQVIEELDESDQSDQVVPRIVRPTEVSAMIYEKASGRLKIHAAKQHVQERLRRLVGEVLFENKDLFNNPESQNVYSLESLKDPGFSLVYESGDPIEGVKLTELSMRLPMQTNPRVTVYTKSGIMLAVENLQLKVGSADLLQAKIQFQFSTKGRKGKTLTVTVKPPNTCTYDHGSPNAHYAEKYLRSKWQIARI